MISTTLPGNLAGAGASATPPVRKARTPKNRRSSREGFKVNWWLTALMLVASLTVLLPLYFTVAMALKSPDQIVTGTGLAWPNPLNWENFAEAYVATNFPRAFMSTAFVTVFSVLGSLACSSLVAYAIARNWNHRFFRGSFVYLLSAMFIPFPVIILPLIKQTALLGLDNPAGVVFLHVLGGMSFNALLYIAFDRSIPVELEESARMDGPTTWQVLPQMTRRCRPSRGPNAVPGRIQHELQPRVRVLPDGHGTHPGGLHPGPTLGTVRSHARGR